MALEKQMAQFPSPSPRGSHLVGTAQEQQLQAKVHLPAQGDDQGAVGAQNKSLWHFPLSSLRQAEDVLLMPVQ